VVVLRTLPLSPAAERGIGVETSGFRYLGSGGFHTRLGFRILIRGLGTLVVGGQGALPLPPAPVPGIALQGFGFRGVPRS